MAQTNTTPNYTKSTRMDANPVIPTIVKTPQQECEEKGGFWDSIRGTCILVKEEKKSTTERTKAPLTSPETFRDKEGNLSGITIPGKGTFLGLSPEQVQEMANREAERKAQPTGTAPVGTAQNLAEQQQQNKQAIGQIGNIPQNGTATQAPIDWGQAMTAGVSNVPSLVKSIGAGAAAGAALGAIPAVATAGLSIPAGAVLGGIGGAISSMWGSVVGNIKKQQSGEIAASMDILSSARTNMRQLAVLAGNDPNNAAEYVQAYNYQLSMVYQARRQLQAETAGNLNKFMEDGTSQLAQFDLFLAPSGTANIYGQKLAYAVATGKAPPITSEDLGQ